ncbi:MAG: SoxR reducing system RseC family protein [Oscillibacter sp.]|nr:SoxR reducing system RseC family protein [Oscillibacter sp.]
MTQIATIERILDSNHAEISVPRKSACGHDCEECAGCGVSGAAVHARAVNTVGAVPGQKVVVQSDTKKMLRIVAFVYSVPVFLFMLGYVITTLLTPTVAVQYAVAAVGFVIGIILAIMYDRHVRAVGGVSFTIVRVF